MDLVLVAIYLLASAPAVIGQLGGGHYLHLVLTVVTAGLLMFRRHRPVALIAVLTVLETVLLVVEPFNSNAGLSLWFALYAVAVRRGSVFSVISSVLVSLPLAVVFLFFFRLPADVSLERGIDEAGAGVITTLFLLLANIIATGIGISVRRDREHEQEVRAWAERNFQLASMSERNRIAREMHDVVAHSLTVMIALADGAAVVMDRDPARARQVLTELSGTGRTALADMRRVLGVLRREAGSEQDTRAPLPAQSGLDDLLEGFRTAGLPVTLALTGPALPADPAFQLTVFRIIQESLTNVLRYGGGVSRVLVGVVHADPLVTLHITDDGRGSLPRSSVGSGQGIAGMQERARIYAGSVTAGPTPEGGWSVQAVLACPRPESPNSRQAATGETGSP
jgi:signal transduction histidine kinase